MDITKEMLEIALCAQHNNGGLAVDMWWQTNVSGLLRRERSREPTASTVRAAALLMRVRSVRCARRSIFPRGEGDSRRRRALKKLAEGILESELKLAFAAT